MKKVFLYTAILFFVACNKKTTALPAPVIVINTPSENQHFVNGDTIYIKGNVTHGIELTEVAVHMTNLTSKNEFFHNHFSAGNKTYFEFNSKYPVADNNKTSFKVEVEATDKNGMVATKEMTITIN
jgi:hypothetical protein